MLVRAKELGFYGEKRRREGAEFEVANKDFSEKWMEEVKKPGRPKKDSAES